MDARLAYRRIRLTPDAVRVVARDAVGLDEVRAIGGDDLRDLDVGETARGAEPGEEGGGEHDPEVDGLAALGLQLGVAANLPVVLAGGRGGRREGGKGVPAVGQCALGRGV